MATATGRRTFGSEKRDPKAYPLNEALYPLSAETPQELEFWKSQTGIRDEEDLKKHIIKVQTEAHAVRVHLEGRKELMYSWRLMTLWISQLFPYGCIVGFVFLK